MCGYDVVGHLRQACLLTCCAEVRLCEEMYCMETKGCCSFRLTRMQRRLPPRRKWRRGGCRSRLGAGNGEVGARTSGSAA